jgi:hypothetical protein
VLPGTVQRGWLRHPSHAARCRPVTPGAHLVMCRNVPSDAARRAALQRPRETV